MSNRFEQIIADIRKRAVEEAELQDCNSLSPNTLIAASEEIADAAYSRPHIVMPYSSDPVPFDDNWQ